MVLAGLHAFVLWSSNISHIDLWGDIIKDEDETSDTVAAGDLMHDDIVDPTEEEIVPDIEEKRQGLGTDNRSEKPDAPSQPISPPKDVIHQVGKTLVPQPATLL